MSKQTTVRLPEQLADQVETIARVKGTSINQLIIDSIHGEMARLRSDAQFVGRARQLIERDRKVLQDLLTDIESPTAEKVWTKDEFFGDMEPPTIDDVPIATDGRRLGSADKVNAYLDEINQTRSDNPDAN